MSPRAPWTIDPANPEQLVRDEGGRQTTAPRFERAPAEFVGVSKSGETIWIGVKDRAEFDRIAAPPRDSGEIEDGRVLTKSVEQHGVRVVFQHWLKSLTAEGIGEQLDRRRAAKERAA